MVMAMSIHNNLHQLWKKTQVWKLTWKSLMKSNLASRILYKAIQTRPNEVSGEKTKLVGQR